VKQSSSGAAAAHPPNGSDRRSTDSAPGDAGSYDWDRLERAVRSLVDQQESHRAEFQALRKQIAERDPRVRNLEAQLIDANHRRQDTGKRIDELIAQLDQLDAQLASAESDE
jgi:septal ring factor EnvC (AmiA/AmiB activator)